MAHQKISFKLICIKDIHKVRKTRHQNLVFGHHKRVTFDKTAEQKYIGLKGD
jgi:hypothetical protein